MENLNYVPKAVVGKRAPEFSGAVWRNGAIENISLKSLEGKYVVLFFYPLDFTFVCPTEICNFSDAYETFTSLGNFKKNININFSI
jgi:alkyl hydroperoxide reductase subunit AhpC